MTGTCRAACGVAAPYDLIMAAGTPIAVRRVGRGAPVLCLHATGHGGRDFDAFTDLATPEGFEVVVVDWPGQGASPTDATGAPADSVRYAAILAELVSALFPEQKPIILGNSIGGMTALRYTTEYPDAVRALVLADPGGLIPIDSPTRTEIGLMVRFFEAGARGAFWYPAAFALYYSLVLPGRPARDQRARIIAAATETASVIRDAWKSFARPDADLRKVLAALDVPVLFTWSRHDHVVSWRRSRAAVARARSAQVQLFDGGHSAFLEAPGPFFEAFSRFALGLGE